MCVTDVWEGLSHAHVLSVGGWDMSCHVQVHVYSRSQTRVHVSTRIGYSWINCSANLWALFLPNRRVNTDGPFRLRRPLSAGKHVSRNQVVSLPACFRPPFFNVTPVLKWRPEEGWNKTTVGIRVSPGEDCSPRGHYSVHPEQEHRTWHRNLVIQLTKSLCNIDPSTKWEQSSIWLVATIPVEDSSQA